MSTETETEKKDSPLLEGLKNAKTTGAAVAAFVGLLAMGIAMPLLDGDDSTSPQWALLVVAVPLVVGLFYAPDAAKKADK